MEGGAKDDLTARVMATFGAEAEEHIEAMNRVLVLLKDHSDAGQTQKLLEPLVREAHSLKGAARAVGVKPVETVAARLEDVSERLRQGGLEPDPAVWDVFRRVLDATSALAREATGGERAGVDPVAIGVMLDDAGRAITETPPDRPEQVPPPGTTDTALSKLEALRAGIDGLAAANAAAAQHVNDLRDLAEGIRDLLLAPPATGEQPVDARPDPAATPKVVLLVEDSQLTRSLQKHLLERAGYEVRAAGDGTEAWNLLQAGGVDVVFSDILMAGMDGFELTARIRADAALRTVPVVLITATDLPERRERSAEVGADAYVLKGSSEHQDLAKIIERLT